MKARQANDVCFSTMNGGHSRLNFDGKERTKLDWDEARKAHNQFKRKGGR